MLASQISTLSLDPPSPEPGAPLYMVTRGRSNIILADHTDFGSRPLGPCEGEEGDAYASVGGLEEQVAELRAALELPLLHPETFVAYGLKPPRGLLLTGPPGTGKSLLLRAAGRELRKQGVHVMVRRLEIHPFGLTLVVGVRRVKEIWHAPSIC